MSQIVPTAVPCPNCGATCPARLFESVNGDVLPVQVDAILDGSFERTTCSRCGGAFQPEHHLLFAKYSARLWIVMYPFGSRSEFAAIESGVADLIARHFAEAPTSVAEGLSGVPPRLVFGQYALAEAVRAARDALDPPLLECTKLLAYRRSLPQLFGLGPTELVYERTDTDQLIFGVRGLASGERLGELAITAALLGETQTQMTDFAASHPELFARPYISLVRYLLGPAAPAV
jgi:hypothetical protein